ncbi:MAG TPA: 2-oxoacid:acceptor oxidoreductase family protein [Gaiellaceae bacterium]|nr:2-oxoacid:acceptor oxidoreductase family protein [Gaiellaceae bacterium]
MRELTEIRWHARAGQGAKSAAQILALALLRSGKSVQAFPEYGPERRGAPLRAYTRFATGRVRRHDSVEEPDLVVVLDDSLLDEPAVREGVTGDTTVLVNTDQQQPRLDGARVRAVPTARFAAVGSASFANVAMLGAVAAALGEPPLETVQEAAVETLGGKVDHDELRAAVAEGYAWRS